MYKDEAFFLGENFCNVALMLSPEDILDEDGDSRWFVPYIVNMAFSCELFLKSFASTGDNMIHGHEWNTIFKDLSPEKKNAILSHPYFKDDEDFCKSLVEGGKLFETWRYCFEKNKAYSVDLVFLEHMTEVMHGLAKNDLQNIR